MTPAIVCRHLLCSDDRTLLIAPVLSVTHDAPIDAHDSGLVLLCDCTQHDNAQLAIVNIERYLPRADGALRELLQSLQVGHNAVRAAVDQPWIVTPLGHAETTSARGFDHGDDGL